ncbi:MAG TPA: efflux RND transporter periplasmic adaptor subunit, partial [Gemmatimonadota bacterium]|nr:efflux RND transporter periplasmic adaptor subunit [Gemmatimonadota bacterium]
YDQAQRDWDRMKQLKQRTPDLVTDTEAEQARTKADVQKALFQSAQHAVSQSQAAVEEAQDRLDKTVIKAPIAGRVTRLNVEKGETAVVGTMNNPGSLLLTVADLSVMEAVVKVDETDVPNIHVGDSASVSIDAWPDSAFAGVVTKVASSAMTDRSSRSANAQSTSDQAVDFEVRIQLDDPPPGIRPDLSCTADVVTATRKDALSIPIISLTLRDTLRAGPAPDSTTGRAGQTEVEGVFQVSGGEVHFRPVQVGIAGDAYFEVTSGLAAGDTVVSGPYRTVRDLEDGNRVRVQKVEGAAPGSPAGTDTAAAGDSGAAS